MWKIYDFIGGCWYEFLIVLFLFSSILGDGFPVISPHIQIMANVQHPSVKDGTFYYVGPAMQQWNPQGSHLINVVKQIEHEFNA